MKSFKPFLPLIVVLAIVACSDDQLVGPGDSLQADDDIFTAAGKAGCPVETQHAGPPPAERVTVDCLGQALEFWPYTGTSFDGTPSDPVNLVFVGEAEPVRIRAALTGLDGDRTAFGLPPVYPFDQVWTDCLGGGVQTTWEDEGGWLGSVIQLSLGDYEPVRVHLRLFETGQHRDGKPVVLGSAHFEVLITGTTDHQVLSWELAEQIVVADLMRSGLLHADAPMVPTGPINPAPGFRTIDPTIYNMLPPELWAVVGTPGPVTEPVPIPTDGSAMILNLAASVPFAPGVATRSATIAFDQYVPRPFCSAGPFDWLYVQGSVAFETTYEVDHEGRYSYHGGYRGELSAVPLDMSTGQPVGPPFTAAVSGSQMGHLDARSSVVKAFDRKLTHEADGPQITFTRLQVLGTGWGRFQEFNRCLDAGEDLAD